MICFQESLHCPSDEEVLFGGDGLAVWTTEKHTVTNWMYPWDVSTNCLDIEHVRGRNLVLHSELQCFMGFTVSILDKAHKNWHSVWSLAQTWRFLHFNKFSKTPSQRLSNITLNWNTWNFMGKLQLFIDFLSFTMTSHHSLWQQPEHHSAVQCKYSSLY